MTLFLEFQFLLTAEAIATEMNMDLSLLHSSLELSFCDSADCNIMLF